jgi:hypothetical protein
MLFHITAKHSVNDCNLYNENVKQALQEFLPSIPSHCVELGLKIHYAVTAAPDHLFYLLVEADNYSAICTLLSAVPMKQEFDIKPVRLLGINNP